MVSDAPRSSFRESVDNRPSDTVNLLLVLKAIQMESLLGLSARNKGQSQLPGIELQMRRGISIRSRTFQIVVLSLGVHLGLLTVAFVSRLRPPVQTVQSELKFYSPAFLMSGGTHAQWMPQPPGRKTSHPASPARKTSSLAHNAHAAPPPGAPVSTPHEAVPGDGTDAQNANPAFPVFSPHPPVTDRSLLPASDQQVIVDVKVNAAGEVLEADLVKGIGNELDEIVLNTVKTWRFHPATLNGNPVPTVAELIFPFNRSYPTTPS
jgi:TonB family protein